MKIEAIMHGFIERDLLVEITRHGAELSDFDTVVYLTFKLLQLE